MSLHIIYLSRIYLCNTNSLNSSTDVLTSVDVWVFSNTSLHLAGGSSWCCGIRLQLSGQQWQGLVAICLQMLCLSPLVTGPAPHKGSAVLGVVLVLVLVPSTGARGKTHKGWD